MAQFIIAYHGGKPFKTKEEGGAHMAKWHAWNKELGDAVVDPGMYFGQSKTVSAQGVSDDGGPNPINGISTLEAQTIQEAIEMVKKCPHLDIEGTIEVAPIMMKM